MNPMLNDDGDQRIHEQRLGGTQRSLVRAVIGLAAFSLAFFGAHGLTRSAHPSNASTAASYLMLFMSLALILISVRWLRPRPSRPNTFSRLRRRIGVVSHFGGVLAFLVMIAVALFRLGLHESPLHLYLWLVFAMIGLCLALLLGKPVLAQYQDLGYVWLRTGSQLDERDLQLRQRALAMTCQILIVATLLAGIFLFWIDSQPWVASPHSSIASLSLLVLTYIGGAGIALPSAILAWTESEPSFAD
jgi:uncharacterized membrane protein YgdD (TMEM256/DUF423 family)